MSIAARVAKQNEYYRLSRPRVSRSEARFIAGETGTDVVPEARDHSYQVHVPDPKPYPWHPNANPTGTVMPMDQAVEANRLYLEQCARKSGGQQARSATSA